MEAGSQRDATPAAGRRRREAAHQTKPPTALAGRGGRAAWTRLGRHYHLAELWAAPRLAWWSLRGAGAVCVYAIAREAAPGIAKKKRVQNKFRTFLTLVLFMKQTQQTHNHRTRPWCGLPHPSTELSLPSSLSSRIPHRGRTYPAYVGASSAWSNSFSGFADSAPPLPLPLRNSRAG